MDDSHSHEPARAHRLLYVALGAAIVAVVALSLVIVMQYRSLESEQLVGPRSSFLGSLKSRGTVVPEDAAFIEEWMTFDYVNYVFSLPPQYLEQTLSITDPRYPRMTIDAYADAGHLNEAATLEEVRSAIESYKPAQ